MAIPRASSGILRSHLPRQAIARTPMIFQNNGMQRRTQMGPPDDLGGPGGQTPPPPDPAGGTDTAKRNWPLIGGGALAVVALYAYLTGGGPSKKDVKKQLEPVARKGEEGLKKVEGHAGNAVEQMSGKKNGMGGFRSE